MKKILSILMLLVAIVTGAQAGETFTVKFKNKNSVTQSTANYFTYNKGEGTDVSWSGKGKHSCTYGGEEYSDVIKMESSTQCFFTSTAKATVTIVQTISNATGDKLKFDGENLDSKLKNTTVTVNSTDKYNEYVITDVAAGTHTITRQAETGLAYVKVEYAATEAFTVSFNAGTNGTCATTSITEESAGAGVTLPTATPNEGYTFDGWYDGETKVGDAGKTYHPTAAVTLTAKYSALTAPSISVDNTSVSTYKSVAVTFTATADGAPDPTVTWYKNESASTTGGTSVGTGLTYQPDVTAEGTYYYYAVASNGVEPDATSEVVTLTVTDPDKYVTVNAYYISEDEVAVAGEKIYGTDITATIVNYSGAAPTADTYLSGINSNYVAQITGSNNGWGPEFVATKNGTLSVGVIINGGKTFTLTNVSSFDYEGVQDEGNNETSKSAGTIDSNTWSPTKKQWVVLTFDVVAGTTYKLSVAGSKMGFYGFVFVPEGATETITTDNGVATYVTKQALDFTGLETKAYVVIGVNDAKTSVATAEVTTVPAGTALLVKGATVEVPVIANATAPAANLFLVSDGNVQGADNIFAYSKSALKFKKVASTVTIPAGKCYLQIDGVSGDALDLDFEGEATAVEAIAEANANAAAPVKVIKNGKLYIGNYNVAGQQVK